MILYNPLVWLTMIIHFCDILDRVVAVKDPGILSISVVIVCETVIVLFWNWGKTKSLLRYMNTLFYNKT